MCPETRSFSGPLPGTGLPLPARGISLEKLLNPFGPGRPARPEAGKIHPVSMIPLPLPPRAPPGGALPRASRPGRKGAGGAKERAGRGPRKL